MVTPWIVMDGAAHEPWRREDLQGSRAAVAARDEGRSLAREQEISPNRLHVSCSPPRGVDRRASNATRAAPRRTVRLTAPLSQRGELARLEVLLHGGVDLVLGGVRVLAPQLPRAQPAEL